MPEACGRDEKQCSLLGLIEGDTEFSKLSQVARLLTTIHQTTSCMHDEYSLTFLMGNGLIDRLRQTWVWLAGVVETPNSKKR